MEEGEGVTYTQTKGVQRMQTPPRSGHGRREDNFLMNGNMPSPMYDNMRSGRKYLYQLSGIFFHQF